MKTQKFGIEIEMTGITRKRAAEAIAQYFETVFVMHLLPARKRQQAARCLPASNTL